MQLRAWWWHTQGLDHSLADHEPATIFAHTGWARSVGGDCPYLTLFTRGAHGRASVDRAVETMAIQELPSARGCTYVMGADDYALALTLARPFKQAETRKARKLGVTEAEQRRLSRAVLDALANGALDPMTLRESLGDRVRSLGEEGKRKGLTTTLPLVLGDLQVRGDIRRIATTGRLDSQRYRYARWEHNPCVGSDATPGQAHARLARQFFDWIGPATVGEFRWFSGLGARAARAALEQTDLVPLPTDPTRLLHPRQVAAFAAYQVPEEPVVSLVSGLDALFLLRRDAGSCLDPADKAHPLLVSTKPSLSDLPYHAIVDRGQIIGLWEYDVSTQSIVWMTFDYPAPETLAAIARTETFVRDELQDARAFSLDSPKRRAPRIARLREYASP